MKSLKGETGNIFNWMKMKTQNLWEVLEQFFLEEIL